MKKTLSLLLAGILLVCTLLTLVSCSKTLSGTYEIDAVVASKSYKFSGNNVTITVSAIAGDDIIYEGTYEIAEDENGKSTITFTFSTEKEGADEYSGTVSFYESEDGSYIKIGGIKYKKK
jgi:hypothetical protein